MRTFAPPLMGCCFGWLRGRLLERAAAADAAALKLALAIGVGLPLTIGRFCPQAEKHHGDKTQVAPSLRDR